MENSLKSSKTIYGIIIGLSIIISAFIFSDALKTIKSNGQKITVKGTADKIIRSDFSIWRGQFSANNTNMVQAYSDIEGYRARVESFLVGMGVDKNLISFSNVTTLVNYKMTDQGVNTNIRESYTLQQMVGIQSNDIDMVFNVSNQANNLIKEGLEFISHQPEFYYTKLDDLKIELLSAATQDARKRAEAMAKNSGSKIGAMASAEQGVFQITPKNSTEISDYGMNDNTTIEKKVQAVVTVDFFIK